MKLKEVLTQYPRLDLSDYIPAAIAAGIEPYLTEAVQGLKRPEEQP